MTRGQDPAERSGYLRCFYRNWRPTRLGRFWNRVFAWLAGRGLLPEFLITLLLKDRRSDRLHTSVLVTPTYEGREYLVSMRGGSSEWVQDVRATGGAAFVKRSPRAGATISPSRTTLLSPPSRRSPQITGISQRPAHQAYGAGNRDRRNILPG